MISHKINLVISVIAAFVINAMFFDNDFVWAIFLALLLFILLSLVRLFRVFNPKQKTHLIFLSLFVGWIVSFALNRLTHRKICEFAECLVQGSYGWPVQLTYPSNNGIGDLILNGTNVIVWASAFLLVVFAILKRSHEV